MADTSDEALEGPFRGFERGVDAATPNNIVAYGYSITITAAFGILSVSRSTAGIGEIIAFAAGVVIACALVGGVCSGSFREELEDEPCQGNGKPFALLSVGLALIAALIVGWFLVAQLLGSSGSSRRRSPT